MSADSQSEISYLRTQIFIQQLALVVIVGCLTVFLYRQASLERKQIVQSYRVINGYKRQEAKIIDVLNQLVAYGQKHPEFTKAVLAKYGVVPEATAK
jgi:hypothetical protein